ncbi:MAG: flagellar motor switch protein FliN [bacterium]|nr:flagellar motor switch protein FliN [bacterium]
MPDTNSNDENIENEALAQEFADFVEDPSADSVKVPDKEEPTVDLSMDMSEETPVEEVAEDALAGEVSPSGIPIAGVAVPEGSETASFEMDDVAAETPAVEESQTPSAPIFEDMEQQAETVSSVAQEDANADDGTVTVQPVQFASFEEKQNPETEVNKNLDILMDIKLQLTVELGRTELPVKNVLELTRGSIVELQKVAGEPVELFANGKLVATGEVVVIEDNFGLRITSITDPEDRIKGL